MSVLGEKEKSFIDRLKNAIKSEAQKRADTEALEKYNQGKQCAIDGIPWEEIQNSGFDNEPEFLRGYNETLENLGKGR